MAVVGAAIAAFSGFVSSAVGAASAWFASSTVLTGLLTTVATSALQTALAKRAMKDQREPGIKTEHTTSGGTEAQSFVIGRYATAGHMVCPPMSHGRRGIKTPNAFLTYVIALGDIPGQTLDSVIIDDEEVTFAPDPVNIPIGGAIPSNMPSWWYEQAGMTAPDPEAGITQVTIGRPAQGDFADKVWIRYHDGTQTTADPFLMAIYGPGTDWEEESGRPWTEDMVGTGTSYIVITFRFFRELFSGLPRCRFVMRGIPLYDPRKDSTMGGSGGHRRDDPTTWEVSHNPMVQCYNVLRGIPIEGGPYWGLGVEAGDLPVASWTSAMNACDINVGGAPQWRSALEISVDQEPLDVLEEILKTCSAQLSEFGGVWKPRVGGPRAPVYFFSDDDIIADFSAKFTPFPGLEQTLNGVQISYPEPEQLWEAKDATPHHSADYEAADQNRRLVANLSLPACPYPEQVDRLGHAYVEDNRRFRRHVLQLPPEADILEALDSVAYTSIENNYDAKIFEVVEAIPDPETGCVTVSLREKDPADYDPLIRPLPWTVPSVIRPRPVIVPQSFTAEGIAITDATGAARRPAARLRWSGWALDGVTAVQWQLRREGQADVARGLIADPEDGEAIVSAGILPATDYEARIRFMTRSGVAVSWTLWTRFRTPDVRIGKADLDADVLADLDIFSGWMDETGPFLRDLRDEIATVRDGIAEIDWGNFSEHDRIRRTITAEVGEARAWFVEEINVAVSETEAVATRVTELAATVGSNTAAISQEQIARANADSALALDVQTVSASAADNDAAITQERLARISADSALATDITAVETSLGTKASTSALTALTTRVSTAEGKITAQSDAITQVTATANGASATGLLRVQAVAAPAGAQTRIGLRAEASSGSNTTAAAMFMDARSDGTSHISFLADRFAIVTGGTAGATRHVPFVVSGGGVFMDTAFIENLTVGTLKLADEAASFIRAVNGDSLTITVSYPAELTIFVNTRVSGVTDPYTSTVQITRNGAVVFETDFSVSQWTGSFTNFLTLSVAPGTHTFTHSYSGAAGDFTARRLAILGKYK